LRRRISTLRMKILGKLGVAGYQPYERMGLWLRRELRPFVKQILLDERTLDRGVFRPETVARVVENHLEQRYNHTALLLAMLIFEVGQREFVDGDLYNAKPMLAASIN
jgi:asparagine synthase (glutamine-hydrolysing)